MPNLGPEATALGVLLADLAGAGAGDGLEEFAAHPELQQLGGHEHVAALSAVVASDADLLPADADDTVHGHLAGDPLLTGAIRSRVGAQRSGPERLTGVTSSSDWCGRSVL